MKAAAALLILFLTVPLHAKDWPNFRGSTLDGISTETDWNPEKVDNIVWKHDVGTGFSSVSIADGRLYTMGSNGKKKGGRETLYCLDATTGKEIWKDSYDARLLPNLHEGGPAATPTVHGGRVYAISKDGRFACYEAADGKLHWQHDLLKLASLGKPPEWGFAGSPLILEDMVVVEAGATIAFDQKTGKQRWKSKKYTPAYTSISPLVHDGRTLLATLKTEGLALLDAATGKELAFTEWKSKYKTSATTPIVRGSQVYLSTGYKSGCGLYEFTGTAFKELYRSKEMSNHMAYSLHIGDHLYGITGNTHGAGAKQLVCMEWRSGKVKWTQKGFGVGSVAAAGDRLLILSEKGELVVAKANPAGFAEIARAQVNKGKCWTVPVLANGRLYTRNADGNLTCSDVSN